MLVFLSSYFAHDARSQEPKALSPRVIQVSAASVFFGSTTLTHTYTHTLSLSLSFYISLTLSLLPTPRYYNQVTRLAREFGCSGNPPCLSLSEAKHWYSTEYSVATRIEVSLRFLTRSSKLSFLHHWHNTFQTHQSGRRRFCVFHNLVLNSQNHRCRSRMQLDNFT